MFKTYDNSSQAFVDRIPKYYDTNSGAWVRAKSGKTYDTDKEAWIERLMEYMTLTVTNGIYDYANNAVYHSGDLLYLDVKPTSTTYYVRARIEGTFIDPLITGLYTFGHSEKYTLGSSTCYSHDAVVWKVKVYSGGIEKESAVIASGSAYRNATVFDEAFTKSFSGTFDAIELECMIISFSSYSNYGLINTQVKDFAVNGTKYYGDRSIVT